MRSVVAGYSREDIGQGRRIDGRKALGMMGLGICFGGCGSMDGRSRLAPLKVSVDCKGASGYRPSLQVFISPITSRNAVGLHRDYDPELPHLT